MAIRLDDIDYFLAVAEHGQVRRAALELGLSQAALTKGLQRLERELGFPLFERLPRGMALTRVAEPFRQRVLSLRGNLDDAIKEAADLHLGAMGVLRVGVSPLYAQQLFVPACLKLHQQRPAARIRVMVSLNDTLTAALRAGDIDLAIHALPAVLPDDLEAVPLMKDDLCMVVRDGHPLLARRRLRLRDLAEAEWMLPGPDVPARKAIEGRLAEAGLPPPKVVVEVNNTATQLSRIIAHSDMLTLMSALMLQGPMGEGLVALPMADAHMTREVGAVVLKGAAWTALARRFVELLQEVTATPAESH